MRSAIIHTSFRQVRTVLSTFACTSLLSCVWIVDGWAQQVFRVKDVAADDFLAVRSEPNSKSEIRGKIPPNSRGINADGQCKPPAWCKIQHGGITGWVNSRFLTPDVAEAVRVDPSTPSADPAGDCNSDDSKRKLSGCKALAARDDLDDSTMGAIHSRLADAEAQSGSTDKAIESAANAVRFFPGDNQYTSKLSHLYELRAGRREKQGDAEAISDYSKAIIIRPDNHRARFARSILYISRNDLDSALLDLTIASELDNGNALYEDWLARLYERRAVHHLLSRNPNQALSDYGEAIKRKPLEARLYVGRATAYESRKDLSAAMQDYVEAVRLRPDYVDAFVRRAELNWSQGKLDETIADATAALRIAPRHVPALELRASALEASGRIDEAAADNRGILRIESGHALAKNNIDRLVKAPSDAVAVSPPADASSEELITALQEELERVGCDPGDIDGEWGTQTQAALVRFAENKKVIIPLDEPSEEALAEVKRAQAPVCSN